MVAAVLDCNLLVFTRRMTMGYPYRAVLQEDRVEVFTQVPIIGSSVEGGYPAVFSGLPHVYPGIRGLE